MSSRAFDFFGCVCGPGSGEAKNCGSGSRRNAWQSTRKEPGV